jgi:N-acetylglucosamine-6-phosphate deacetylase
MTTTLVGRAVLPERIVAARIELEGDRIAAIRPDPQGERGPIIAPGFVDLHVHGWGGHDAMGGIDALAGMARALAARGVTSFLPTAVSAALPELATFAASVRAFRAQTSEGAEALGSNLEGPFLNPLRCGAHAPEHLRAPRDVDPETLEPLLDGLRVMTVAPELPGALELIGRLAGRGVVVSLGHSDATLDEALAGYAAGARSTTHLFNAMTGLDHRAPGLAAAALADDAVAVELIADGHHVDLALWPIVWRAKPDDRLLLASDAIAPAGSSAGTAELGVMAVAIRDGRATVAGTETLAGSLIGLDDAVRNLVAAGAPLTRAVAAASANPARLLGLADRGGIAPGLRADIVELDDELRVTDVLVAGRRP